MSTHDQSVIDTLQNQYEDVVLSDAVKERIDKTIERYGVAKSLLELHALSLGLCLDVTKKPDEEDTN